MLFTKDPKQLNHNDVMDINEDQNEQQREIFENEGMPYPFLIE